MASEQAEAAWERYLDAEYEEPPFDQDHHRYHTPNSPVEDCANCLYVGWAVTEDHDRALFMAGWEAATGAGA